MPESLLEWPGIHPRPRVTAHRSLGRGVPLATLCVRSSDSHFWALPWDYLGVSFGEDQAALPDASGSHAKFKDCSPANGDARQDPCPVSPWLS